MTSVILPGLLISMGLALSITSQTQPQKSQANGPQTFDNSNLLESGQGKKLRSLSSMNEFRIVSYNIRWRSGEDLKKLIQLFRDDKEIGNATVLALQEVDRNKQRSGRTNTAKLLADELGLYYAWAAPPPPKPNAEEETGVALLSVYPLSKVSRIVLPHEGPDHRRRIALGASIQVNNVELRIYSAHAETRISMDKKLDQMSALLSDLGKHSPSSPAVIMGDLNTWQSDAERKTIKLFTAAGFTTPFGNQTTFLRRVLFVPIDLRLDWIWFRGLEIVSYGIDRQIAISDHWPLWTTFKLQNQKP